MEKLNALRRVLATIFALGACQVAGDATASVIYHDAAARDYVIGINDLEINKSHYDITFVVGTFQNVFGDPANADFLAPAFWNSESDAIDASNSVAATLNREAPIPFLSPEFTPFAFFVPFGDTEFNGSPAVVSINACGGTGTWFGVCGTSTARIDALAKWAVVPEPATLALLALGLAGLGFSRRKH